MDEPDLARSSLGKPHSSELEFIRPQFAFEREFGQFRNWWARDKRIVGNAFSLLMYLVSHHQTFRITQQKARHDLGLGRDAFLAARRRLEAAGFLTAVEMRHPAGATDAGGHPIGGHRYIVYSVNDPIAPQLSDDDGLLEASTDNPPRPQSHPSAENPATENPPVKKTNFKEDIESSSSSGTAFGDFVPASPERIGERLRESGLVAVDGVDVQRAIREVLAASRRPVGDPVAYVAASIEREPRRWLRQGLEAGDGRNSVGANPAAPSIHTHRYFGNWNEVCVSCGAERPGWRIDRDADDELLNQATASNGSTSS